MAKELQRAVGELHLPREAEIVVAAFDSAETASREAPKSTFSVSLPRDKGSHFYVIAAGEVEMIKDGHALRRLVQGGCFGERAVRFEEPWPTSFKMVHGSFDDKQLETDCHDFPLLLPHRWFVAMDKDTGRIGEHCLLAPGDWLVGKELGFSVRVGVVYS
eukprot:symbB.v1.2.031391.t1/scaffold3641.1/size52776/4